jgi:hypothetical protein
MKNNPWLKRCFHKYNELYFGGLLPDAVVFWEPAFVTRDELGELYQDKGTFVIRIDPSIRNYTKALARMTLLHEMAHMKLWPDIRHGRKFNDEMLRLAQLGALKGLW